MRVLAGLIGALVTAGAAYPAPPPPENPPLPPSESFPADQWVEYWFRVDRQLREARSQAINAAIGQPETDDLGLDIRVEAASVFGRRRFRLDSVCPDGSEDPCELRLISMHLPSASIEQRMEMFREAANSGLESGRAIDEWPDLTERFRSEIVDVQTTMGSECPGILHGLEAIEAVPLRIDWAGVGQDEDWIFDPHPWWYSIDFGLITIGAADATLSIRGTHTSRAREIADAFLGELGDCGIRALNDFPVGE